MRSPVRIVLLLCLVFSTEVAYAQLSHSDYWPVDVGRVWEYDVHRVGPFDQSRSGVVRHTVTDQRTLGSGVVISCFDVDSTVPVNGGPLPMLLAVSDCTFAVGLVADNDVALGSWSDHVGGWEWLWVGADLTTGATFHLPIRTAVKNDAFLNGVIRTTSGSVSTPSSVFTNALVVDYVVELGESEIIDATSGLIGTASYEVTGWVAFVSGVGPVASEESFSPVSIDCPTCPAEFFETVTSTFKLSGSIPISNEYVSFGALKARY